MLNPEEKHVPVLLERCLELLGMAFDGIENPVAIDATLGMGGHSYELLKHFPNLRLICIDRDQQAINLAKKRLAPFNDRVHFYHGVYSEIYESLANAGFGKADAILFDLGVSSFQLDEKDRGFAYSYDAPLDMRMDDTAELTAEIVVNEYSEVQLIKILKEYGQERFAKRIATKIIKHRKQMPFTRTGELVEVIRSAVPVAAGKKGGHPAKRSFQAIRIEVNQELEILKQAIPAAIDNLKVGGAIVAMAYHSLEDKIVKRNFTKGATSSAPYGLPIELEEHKPYLKLLVRGAEKASGKEILRNSRASSVRLRAVTRVKD
ncbi:MAG: 16S rRNA (cytosine(1402)-N(4))-methyltransferase RsmH [Micrococcaceae bacterium]